MKYKINRKFELLKRLKYTILLCIIFISYKSNVYGISEDFKFVIDTIGIPRYNVYNEEINEDIYAKYNVFSYSSPEKLLYLSDQRFKEVPYLGKWQKNGLKGEYNFLGQNYSGQTISNVYFPVDVVPETTPNYWNYIYTPGALESWREPSKFKNKKQKKFMQNCDMMFDEIDFVNKKTNPYNLIKYGISANMIGLEKVTIDTASTWKTKGIFTARRLVNNKYIRYAIFSSEPMAINANIISQLEVNDNVTIEKDEDYVNLSIKFGAMVEGLNDYATKENIKEIVSVLYINGKEISKISQSKNDSIKKNEVISLSRNEYSSSKIHPLDIKVKSYLYTEFNVDGLIKNEINKKVNLNVLKKEVIPVRSSNLYTLEKNNNEFVLKKLIKTTETNNENSCGIIEKEKYLAIVLGKNISDTSYEIYLNNNKIDFEKISSNEKYDVIKIKVDNKLDNTINSWNYLRNKTNNYFSIDFDNIGNRIKKPNIINIITNKMQDNVLLFDTIDEYDLNFNFNFNNVLNIEELKKTIKISEIEEINV